MTMTIFASWTRAAYLAPPLADFVAEVHPFEVDFLEVLLDDDDKRFEGLLDIPVVKTPGSLGKNGVATQVFDLLDTDSELDLFFFFIASSPHHPREVLIKRVIALEGDTIRTLGYKNRYVTVPEGHCWLEGDHREVSLDSNYFGPIALGLLHAKASHIVWPLRRCQKVESYQPADRPILMGESLAIALEEMFVDNENSLSVELEDEFGIIRDKT
nr:mitochondrial inner membrane protease subunit 2-like [Lytechinus pictus]